MQQVSFITVCYNGFEDTCDLIDSIQETVKSIRYEIIVVDNASIENEALKIQSKYPFVITIRSEINLGFAGGNNLGLAKAEGEFLFFINNDAVVTNDSFINLVKRLEENPQMGGLSPKICFAWEPQLIQFAGFTPLSKVTLRNEVIGYNQKDNGLFDKPHKIPYLHGAAMLIKREAIEKVGKMPEIYFLYYEEIDWSISLRKAGYELWYDPACTILHKESQSTGKQSPLQAFYMTRNRLLLAKRHLKRKTYFLSVVYQLTIAIPKDILKYAIRGNWKIVKAKIKGAYHFIKEKPTY